MYKVWPVCVALDHVTKSQVNHRRSCDTVVRWLAWYVVNTWYVCNGPTNELYIIIKCTCCAGDGQIQGQIVLVNTPFSHHLTATHKGKHTQLTSSPANSPTVHHVLKLVNPVEIFWKICLASLQVLISPVNSY